MFQRNFTLPTRCVFLSESKTCNAQKGKVLRAPLLYDMNVPWNFAAFKIFVGKFASNIAINNAEENGDFQNRIKKDSFLNEDVLGQVQTLL